MPSPVPTFLVGTGSVPGSPLPDPTEPGNEGMAHHLPPKMLAQRPVQSGAYD